MQKIELFRNLDKYDKLKLLDGLKVHWFKKKDAIINAGEKGEMFYIIEEGQVDCLAIVKTDRQRQQEFLVRKLNKGDHFGEVALLNVSEVRTLTIRCASDQVKLLALDRATFNRILGAIEQYLHRDYSSDLNAFSFKSDSELQNLTLRSDQGVSPIDRSEQNLNFSSAEEILRQLPPVRSNTDTLPACQSLKIEFGRVNQSQQLSYGSLHNEASNYYDALSDSSDQDSSIVVPQTPDLKKKY